MKTIKKSLGLMCAVLGLSQGLLAGSMKHVVGVDNGVAPISEASTLLDNLYVGLALAETFVRSDQCGSCDEDAKTLKDYRYGATLVLGWDTSDYLGLEARGLRTFGEDAFTTVTHYGLYAKPKVEILDDLEVYGLMGYGQTRVDYDNGIKTFKVEERSFSYGLGMKYEFSEYDINKRATGWAVWMDYQFLLKDSSKTKADVNAASLGVSYYF